tara:strand:+ start:38073 stop:38384 length:312 start_codon:yes stop_codon:yes gene_type:complete
MRHVRHDSGNDHPEEWGGNGPDHPDHRDWDLSEGLDPEGPSAMDLDQFGSELDTCPNCNATIYDQSEMCPECGWYLGEAEKSVSLWVFVGVVGLIVILLFWMI